MVDEFGSLDSLKSLSEDAKQAASLVAEVGSKEPTEAKVEKEVQLSSPSVGLTTDQMGSVSKGSAPTEKPRHVSTMLMESTHRRLNKAAKLQAAYEKQPDSAWAILEEAATRWLDENGY